MVAIDFDSDIVTVDPLNEQASIDISQAINQYRTDPKSIANYI